LIRHGRHSRDNSDSNRQMLLAHAHTNHQNERRTHYPPLRGSMLAKLYTYSLLGIDAVPVEVEVDISPGALPKMLLVGLPEAAVRESTHRIARAMANSGYIAPNDRVVINLAPAELPKQAASFDLPMTIGLLVASGQLQSDKIARYAAVGELALDGTARPVKGALSMAIEAAKQKHLTGLVVPRENAAEAAVVESLEVIPVSSLAEAVAFYGGQLPIDPMPSQVNQIFQQHSKYEEDFSDVRGQEMSKRAIAIAASGAHNLLMIGPPGSGKSMLARRLPTVLPPLLPAESIATTRIYSSLGRLAAGQPLLAQRPFRAPHHTISDAGLVGGGNPPTPGEISLSHHGVLFLDELPEFNRRTLEVLRQPLEDHHVTISRAHGSTTFPAEFMLVAALNPCPCGLSERSASAVPLQCATDRAVHGKNLGAFARPDRYSYRSAGGALQRVVGRDRWNQQRGDAGRCRASASDTARSFREYHDRHAITTPR
jgi:magnesium chelatase family protein